MKQNFKFILVFLFLALTMSFVSAHAIRINFYDENSLSAIPTVTITDANGSTYTSDVNGLWNVNLVGAKSFEISKTGYDSRPLEFYFTEDANYNFLLNPTGLDSSIGFIVKDSNNNLWTNKYLMFDTNNFNNYNIIKEKGFETITNWTYTESSSNYVGLQSTVWKTEGTYSYLIDAGSGTSSGNSAQIKQSNINFKGIASIKFDLRLVYPPNTTVGTNKFSILIDSTEVYSKAFTQNSTNTYLAETINLISYNDINSLVLRLSSTQGACYIDNIIITYNINQSNKTIVNSLLTSSSGTATASLLANGDYNALLYDATGTLVDTYEKTTVAVNKPKNEVTLADISPYDVSVGGLLSYSLTNQSASSISFNVFAGTTDYYDVTVVDYNATPSNRLYVPRKYQVIVPMGSDYYSTYSIQPYLLSILDAVVPRVYVVDTFSRALEGIRLDIFKYLNNQLVLIESLYTDSVGKASFSGYPLDAYYFKAYYNNILKSTTDYVPTEDAEPHYIIIDTIPADQYSLTGNILINLQNTPESVGYLEDLDVNALFYSTQYDDIIDVNFEWYDGTTLLDSELYNTALTDYYTTITKTLTNPHTLTQDTEVTRLVITVRYTDNGTTNSKSFYKYININPEASIPTVFESMQIVGATSRLLTLFLSIIITIAILFMVIRSGVVASPSAITLLGLLLIGFFVFVGWISTGLSIFGTDPLKFLYVILVMISLYFMYNNQGN